MRDPNLRSVAGRWNCEMDDPDTGAESVDRLMYCLCRALNGDLEVERRKSNPTGVQYWRFTSKGLGRVASSRKPQVILSGEAMQADARRCVSDAMKRQFDSWFPSDRTLNTFESCCDEGLA